MFKNESAVHPYRDAPLVVDEPVPNLRRNWSWPSQVFVGVGIVAAFFFWPVLAGPLALPLLALLGVVGLVVGSLGYLLKGSS